MKDQDIFASHTYEECITLNNNRLKFAMARKCRLYHYEKEIGVNFSVFLDHLDTNFIDDPRYCSFGSSSDEPGLKVIANVEVLNHDTGSYDSLGESVFPIEEKEWSTQELRLRSAHIDDDSQISIRFTFEIENVSFKYGGFLKKKITVFKSTLPDGNIHILESILDGERRY